MYAWLELLHKYKFKKMCTATIFLLDATSRDTQYESNAPR